MKLNRALALASAPALSLFASCHIHIDDTSGSWSVNGVHLEEEHVDSIEVLRWDPAGLEIDVGVGDVTVLATDGASEIEATLRETEPGDARLEYREGKLSWETRSEEPAAITNVIVRVNGQLPSLTISTGAGDVDIRDVVILNALIVSTGAGDIRVSGVGRLTASEFESGAGDIRLSGFKSPMVMASSGAGDLDLRDITTDQAELSSGVGDISAKDCQLGVVDASTGIGDIDVSESGYTEADLSTGIGDIDRADG